MDARWQDKLTGSSVCTVSTDAADSDTDETASVDDAVNALPHWLYCVTGWSATLWATTQLENLSALARCSGAQSLTSSPKPVDIMHETVRPNMHITA